MGWHAAVTVLIILCVLAQASAMALSRYLRPGGKARIPETLYEAFILLHVIALSALHGQTITAHYSGILYGAGFDASRLAVAVSALPVAALACAAAARAKDARRLPPAAFACLTAYPLEAAFGGAYAWLYVTALTLWLGRGVLASLIKYRLIRDGLSSASIKEAIDSMHAGVAFGAHDGHALLVNARMAWLMAELTGAAQRNVERFHESLVSGALREGCERLDYGGRTVMRLPDRTAWRFTRTALPIKGKAYVQLTADDVTERWALTERLRLEELRLKVRGGELKDTLASLQALSREKAIHDARLRAHDILGGLMAVLLHSVRGGQAIDPSVLRSLSRGLPVGLGTRQGSASPQDRLNGLRSSFSTIGVGIAMDGELPGDEAKGNLFMDVIGEGVANAVRHGFATRVDVRVSREDGGWRLAMADNGRPPAQPITEGGGIGGMRSGLGALGGTLSVSAEPRFLLEAFVPEGITDG